MTEEDVKKLYGNIKGVTKRGEDPGWDLYKNLTKTCSACSADGDDGGFVGLYNDKMSKVPYAWRNNPTKMKGYKALCKVCAKQIQEASATEFTPLSPPKPGQSAIDWVNFNLLSVQVIYNKVTGENLTVKQLGEMYEQGNRGAQS